MENKILFVYNAGSGLFSAVTDWVHKILSPKTYECSLCALTHGSFTMHEEWKRFIDSLPAQVEFLYRDEFTGLRGEEDNFPAVFSDINGKLTCIISAREIRACSSLDELKALVAARVHRSV